MSISIETAYKLNIDAEYGQLGKLIDWCKINCLGEWKFQVYSSQYTFFFETERDYIAFTLWKK